MFCKNCGLSNVEDANFCEYCGTKLNEICPRCWKKNGQPGSCPTDKCD
ncbi:zinc-ribbon domain-containing protein [Thermanaerosceptrum fracticalcis]|uniref:Zinc-ribbon domain-containing protein n=1 Tax=Thermanaerosceptrum fracticalcis TaxID=1712410 RepID=A0A7G6E1C0_THEFR|nr:zinc ribbon domain-containing protein [Thermanaerosceptrum fracticalcis]QNB45874.1 zinc-ribbon domain-containing protein [Thermanaerosceptrum fracticalcis]